MIRQRIHLREFGLAGLVLRLLVTLLGLALVFYGAMVVLGAFKLSADTINSISAYRTVDHTLGSITAGDITGTDRIIVAVAGVLCLLVFGPLAWRALPRPYLARTDLDLAADSGAGTTEIGPRALERAAELSSRADRRVVESRARYGSGALDVQVQLADTGDEPLLTTLRTVQDAVHTSFARQGLPAVPVDITLAGAPAPRIPKEDQT